MEDEGSRDLGERARESERRNQKQERVAANPLQRSLRSPRCVVFLDLQPSLRKGYAVHKRPHGMATHTHNSHAHATRRRSFKVVTRQAVRMRNDELQNMRARMFREEFTISGSSLLANTLTAVTTSPFFVKTRD